MSESSGFGPWLERQLKRQGMSQADFADRLSVTRAAVSAWVNTRAFPRPPKLQAIADALGLEVATVMAAQEPTTSADRLTWCHRPEHPDGGRELGNAAAFAFDADLRVAAREATQNSLDERCDPTEPVRVRFTLNELTDEHLRAFQDALRWDQLVPHYRAAVDHPQKVGRVLADGLKDLEERKSLLLLKIDDYNASGLTGDEYGDGRFARVVRRQLDSGKSGASGGSYGLGKSTLWAASRFGMVLMNSTLSQEHEGRRMRRVIGRLDLPWRIVEGRGWAGPAWFGQQEPDRPSARSWWADEETVASLQLSRTGTAPGTTFLIVGAHDAGTETVDLPTMHQSIIEGLAKDFWACMVSTPDVPPMLEASVAAERNGAVVVAEEQVDPYRYEPARSRAMRAHLEGTTVDRLSTPESVRTATVTLKVPPLKGEKGGKTTEHKAVLLVTPSEDADHGRVVGMRSTRMIVIDKPVTDVPPGAPRFQAVLLAGQATGSQENSARLAEEFLRAAEPPEHNAWRKTEDLVVTYARGAIARINEFNQAISRTIHQILSPPDRDTGDDGPESLRRLLNLKARPTASGTTYPRVSSVRGNVQADGAWRIDVEVRLPARDDPWLMVPVLRFGTRSGPKPEVPWLEITPLSGCTKTDNGELMFDAGTAVATFTGISDVTAHPVSSAFAVAEVDLHRLRGAR